MTIRQLAAGLLVSAALAAFPATADASPLSHPLSQPRPEPGGDSAAEVRTVSTVRDSLMKELLAEYAASHRRSVHNEIVLAGNVPASAVL